MMPTWVWLLICFGCVMGGYTLGALMAMAGLEPLPPEEGDGED